MVVRWVFRVVLGVLLVSVAGEVKAFHIRLYGLVTEHFSGSTMAGVQVRLVKDSVERETVITGRDGKYEIFLERGYDYMVWFHRADLVTKHVRIDARGIPLFPDVPFYEMDVQMTVFTWIDDFDFGAFALPVARAEYKHSVRNLSWVVEYTQTRQAEIARVMVLYQRAIVQRQQATIKEEEKSRGRKPHRRVVDF